MSSSRWYALAVRCTRFLKQHLCDVRASFIPVTPEDRERVARERVDLATLYLIQASVADCSAQAMPYPEFVARGWAVPNITNYHPFDRLGLWCSYMNEYKERPVPGPWDLDGVVGFARSVRQTLMDTFNVVDNPIRFPLLEPVRGSRRPCWRLCGCGVKHGRQDGTVMFVPTVCVC